MLDSVQVLGPIQTRIVEALESGKYRQIRFEMCDNERENCFCALGLIAYIIDSPITCTEVKNYKDAGLYSEHGTMKSKILNNAGYVVHSIMGMNDGTSPESFDYFTFKQIAAEMRKLPSAFFSESK
jgi:hypothetical protein